MSIKVKKYIVPFLFLALSQFAFAGTVVVEEKVKVVETTFIEIQSAPASAQVAISTQERIHTFRQKLIATAAELERIATEDAIRTARIFRELDAKIERRQAELCAHWDRFTLLVTTELATESVHMRQYLARFQQRLKETGYVIVKGAEGVMIVAAGTAAAAGELAVDAVVAAAITTGIAAHEVAHDVKVGAEIAAGATAGAVYVAGKAVKKGAEIAVGTAVVAGEVAADAVVATAAAADIAAHKAAHVAKVGAEIAVGTAVVAGEAAVGAVVAVGVAVDEAAHFAAHEVKKEIERTATRIAQFRAILNAEGDAGLAALAEFNTHCERGEAETVAFMDSFAARLDEHCNKTFKGIQAKWEKAEIRMKAKFDHAVDFFVEHARVQAPQHVAFQEEVIVKTQTTILDEKVTIQN